MAVAIWTHRPTPDALLDDRLARGWAPIPSSLAEGPQVLGHAAKVPRERWRWK